jgi:hypothetical protein
LKDELSAFVKRMLPGEEAELGISPELFIILLAEVAPYARMEGFGQRAQQEGYFKMRYPQGQRIYVWRRP